MPSSQPPEAPSDPETLDSPRDIPENVVEEGHPKLEEVLVAQESAPIALPEVRHSVDQRILDAIKIERDRWGKVILPYYKFVRPDGSPWEGDAVLPSADQIIEKQFIAERRKLVKKLFSAGFILVPRLQGAAQMAWLRMIDSIDKNRVKKGQGETAVNQKAYGVPSFDLSTYDQSDLRIVGWDAYFGENTPIMRRPGETLKLTLDRFAFLNESKSYGFNGTSPARYAAAQMDAIGQDNPLDPYPYETILDDTPCSDPSSIFTAMWDTIDRRLCFAARSIDRKNEIFQTRLWVGGIVS